VTVEGWIEPSQQRPTFGPEDPGEGRLVALNRVDVRRIDQQTPMSLEPVYVVEIAERTTELPVPVEPPDFGDEGPHLAYAIQWFGFTIIGLVGYYALARRQLRQSA
jgi:surfeit locus 1 family protein